jgi:DNA-binding phage protein
MAASRKGNGPGKVETIPDHSKLIHDHVMEAIKCEIDRQELTYYRIAKEAGISSAALSRFRRPGGTLKTQSLLALLHYLEIELVSREGTSIGLRKINRR